MHNDELFNELLSEIYSKGKEYKEKKEKEKYLLYEKINSANELLKEIHDEYCSNVKKLLKVAKDNNLSIIKIVSDKIKDYSYFTASLINDNVICFGLSDFPHCRGAKYVETNGTFVNKDFPHWQGDKEETKDIGFKYMIKEVEYIPSNLPYCLKYLNFFLEHGKDFAAKLIATVTIDLLKQSEEKVNSVSKE